MNHSVSGSGKWRKSVVYIILILWALISLFPVYWMLTFSLKTNAEIFGENVVGLPRDWVWENYRRALNTGNMPRYFLNSLIVAVTTIVITLAASVMATYAITRLRWKGRKRMNSFFMLGLTIPIHASIVPLYTTLAKIKLLDTLWALIIPYSVGIYTFLQCWNELMFANVFVNSDKWRTLPVGVQSLSGQYTTDWGPIGAALSLATIPTLIFYVFMSKKIQDSFIAGAVKG